MQKTSPRRPAGLPYRYLPVLLACSFGTIPNLSAQNLPPAPSHLVSVPSLPDAPSTRPEQSLLLREPQQVEPDVQPAAAGKVRTLAAKHAGVIEPGEIAPPLRAQDKRMLGLRRAVSPMAITGWFFSAGYGQLNDTPHYGSDCGGFGERLGAAAIRDLSEAVITDDVAAVAFRQDPRYYRFGRGHSIGARIGNAAVQPFLTRTDSGNRAINISLLTGTLAGSALTNTYYPKVDRGAGQTFETFGFSMEGSVIGNLVREFFPDLSGLIFSRIR